MAKAEWGTKRICHNCGAAFYDLRKEPPVCPKCGTEYDPEAILKSRRSRAPLPEDKAPARVVMDEEVEVEAEVEVETEAEEVADDLVEDEAEEEEEELIEDASELGEDEDDMAEVIENIGEEEER